MRTALSWGALVIVTGSACGGDGRPDISTTHDSVCADVADVACFNMYRCCAEGEIEEFLGVSEPRSEEECRDDVRRICERQLGVFEFSVKNNRVRFDDAIMNDCLESLVAPDDTCITISAATPWTEACMELAWVGIVDTGSQCDFAYECAEDNFCSSGRVCTRLPGDGMACGQQGCASGLFCDVGTCRLEVAEGGACTATFQCQEDLFCDTAGATPTRTCTRLRAIGERCTGSASCDSATCLPGTCAGSTSSCFTSASCLGQCEGDTISCTSDLNCGIGTCSGTQTLCSSQATCTPPSTCVFPIRCIHPECVGDIVCAEARVAVDYCQGALNSLPFFDR